MSGQPEPAPPGRRRSFLRRLLAWSLGIGLLAVLVLGGAAIWFWQNRVPLANRVLQTLGPLSGAIGSVDYTGGGIEVRDFELRDPGTGKPLLRLPKAVVSGTWAGVLARRISAVEIDAPEVMLDEAVLDSLRAAAPAGGGAALPGGWRIARLTVRNARVQLARRGGGLFSLVANWRGDEIAVTSDGLLRTGVQDLTLERATARPGADAASLVLLDRLQLRGRVDDNGVLDLDGITLDWPALRVTPALVDLFRGTTGGAGAPDKPRDAPATAGGRAGPPALLRGLRSGAILVRGLDLAAAGFEKGNATGFEFPQAAATLSYESAGIEWMFGSPPVSSAQKLVVENLDIAAPNGGGHLRCASIAAVAPAPSGSNWRVEGLLVTNPDVRWTPELRRLLVRGPAPATPGAGGSPPWSLLLRDAAIEGAKIVIADAGLMPFGLNAAASLKVRGLAIDARGFHGGEEQSLEVTDLTLAFPGTEAGKERKPFFELPHGLLVATPDAWGRGAIAKLALEKPVVRLRDGNTSWFDGANGAAPGPGAAPPAAAAVERPWWERLHFAELAVVAATLDLATRGAKAVDAQAVLNVSTPPGTPGRHRLSLEDVTARLPTLTVNPFPVARASLIECTASLPGLWQTRRIEELRFRGASVEASDALMKFFEQEKAGRDGGAGARAPAGRSGEVGWSVGRFSIADSSVTLDRLVPGMASVKFGLSVEIADAPLSAEGLAASIAPQRVELANLRVPSPYESLRSVATLDSVFVNFTLAGLMSKQIDKVEVVSPTLYVGEDLFWYVEYYRQYAAQGRGAPAPRLAARDPALALPAAAAVVALEPPASEAAWGVRTLQVHSGKLVLAPKGIPLKGFRAPFPFGFVSEVRRGELEADFEIPPDTYTLEDLKLEFQGMSGKVQFNLPVKGRDNNLTETFRVDRIRWKELHVEDAFLTVTYDAAGIYGKFGGNAYEGYVNGQFNVYLDDNYTWDGWVAGKNVQLREITDKLTPGYFRMNGNVAASVVAQGNAQEVFQADGSFLGHGPGRFSVESLDDLIRMLPDEWEALKRQLAQISLETLRDFAYERAEGAFRTHGREGTGKLRFTGPTGSRNFEVNAYDHRWRTDPPPEKRRPATSVTFPAE